MINYKEKILYTHTIMKEVKYECSYVYIVMTNFLKPSLQELLGPSLSIILIALF